MSKAINIRNQAAAAPVGPACEIDLQQLGISVNEQFTAHGADAYVWTGVKTLDIDLDALMAAKEISIAQGLDLDADGKVAGYFDIEVTAQISVVAKAGRQYHLGAGVGTLRIELMFTKSGSGVRLSQLILGSQLAK